MISWKTAWKTCPQKSQSQEGINSLRRNTIQELNLQKTSRKEPHIESCQTCFPNSVQLWGLELYDLESVRESIPSAIGAWPCPGVPVVSQWCSSGRCACGGVPVVTVVMVWCFGGLGGVPAVFFSGVLVVVVVVVVVVMVVVVVVVVWWWWWWWCGGGGVVVVVVGWWCGGVVVWCGGVVVWW